jgi:putative membrane protein
MTDLADAIASINKGVGDLKDGADKLSSGASSLSSGSSTIADALNTLSTESQRLANASEAINIGLNPPPTPGQPQVSLPEALNGISSGLDTLRGGYINSFGALSNSINNFPNGIEQTQIEALLLYNKDSPESLATINSLISFYTYAMTVKGTYDDDNVGKFLNTDFPDALEDTSQNIADIAVSAGGIATLATDYNRFHVGLTGYLDGVRKLSDEYGAFNSGVSSLAGGASELAEGISKLHDGTGKLEDATSDMSIQIEDEIDELLDIYTPKDFQRVSFVSEKNLLVDSVQFVIKTEGIRIPEEVVETDDNQVSKSFLDKFLDLFK